MPSPLPRLIALLAVLLFAAPAAGAATITYSTGDPVVLQFASQNGAVREANQGTWGPTTNLGTGFAEPSTRVDVGISNPFSTPSTLNAFFSFDLSSLANTLILSGETISSASFVVVGDYAVDQVGNNGFEAIETFGLFDVATLPSVLNENIGESDAIFADLGSGASYGTTDLVGLDGNAPAPPLGTGFTIALNAAGLTALAAYANGSSATDYLSFGLSLLTGDLDNGDELLAFSDIGGQGTPRGELVITTVPEASTGVLLGLSLAFALAGRTRRPSLAETD